MAYPKPLSEKTLARMYREANIDEEKSEFLHKLFLAAANLYGVVVLRDMWKIMRAVAKQYGMEGIKRRELIDFSSIARRENVPYYVYEIDELYSAEKRAELDREIVNKKLIKAGYASKNIYYELAELQAGKPYYIPEDILSYAAGNTVPEETKLLSFLKKLKVTATESENRFGKKFVCEHVGKTLGSFSFRSSHERFEYSWFGGECPEHPHRNEKVLQELDEKTSCSEAEKILLIYKADCHAGQPSPAYSVHRIFDELNEVGVELSEKQTEELLNMLMTFNNNSHLWCNRGWTPMDMARQMMRDNPNAMPLPPELRQAIADKDMAQKASADGFGKPRFTFKQ